MVSEKMVAWGSQGCVIRDLAAYGEQRAAVVGAENVFNFTIGNPSVPAPSCVRQTIEHLLQTVPAEQLHAYTAAPGLASVRAKMAAYLEKTFGVGYRAEDERQSFPQTKNLHLLKKQKKQDFLFAFFLSVQIILR